MTNHETLQALLPWFVNGSLNEKEQAMVDQHIKNCDICLQDIEQLVNVSTLFSAPHIQHGRTEAARDRFMENLSKADDVVVKTQRSRVWLALVGFLCALTIGIQLNDPDSENFRTLGTIPDENVPVIQIVFDPEATEQAIRQILFADGNQLISGPTRHGVYRVGIIDARLANVYVARLKRHEDVMYVELESR